MPHDGHHHSHPHPHSSTRSIAFAFWLNLFFSVFELLGGFWTGSYAILSDALHDFGDSISLGLAYLMEVKSHQKGSPQFSYGFRRYSVLSAVFTGAILLVGSGIIIFESVSKLIEGNSSPHAQGMIGLACVGLLVNGVSYWRLAGGKSLSEKMLQWHFIEDVLGWALVLVTAVVMLFWDLPYLDPLLAVGLSSWVIWNVIRNLRGALRVLLQAAPDQESADSARQTILQVPGVKGVHHVHMWSVDGEKHILTAHVVVQAQETQMLRIRNEIKQALHEKHNVLEATLEVEFDTENCMDPEH